jgi:hypothetical protein
MTERTFEQRLAIGNKFDIAVSIRNSESEEFRAFDAIESRVVLTDPAANARMRLLSFGR